MREHRPGPRTRHVVLSVLLAGLMAATTAAPAHAAPAPALTPQQVAVKNALNKDRKAKGLRLLTTHPSAQVKAQALANKLAKDQRLSHSPSLTSGIKPCFVTVGENVGYGGNVAAVQKAFMASTIHRNNILSVSGTTNGRYLNRNWNSVGVGYAVGKNKMVYVVQIFVLTKRC